MTTLARRGRPHTWNCAPQTALGRLGEERELAPVTLPKLAFMAGQDDNMKEAAEQIATTRTIRVGRDAWQAINRAESFDGWRAIGAALAVGKHHALKVTGANAAWGRNYSREFAAWMKRHGFDKMAKSVRSVAVELHENANAIEAWRATLPERQRKRLVHPLSNVRRWRAATAHGNGKCPQDLRRDAMAAWRRFVSCVKALPADEAAPLWQAALAEAQCNPFHITHPPIAFATEEGIRKEWELDYIARSHGQ
jgi:hypothetical protein